MKGNHIVWGRMDETGYPDVTTEEERKIIESCVLKKTKNRKTWFDVFYKGNFIGRARTIYGGQEYQLPGSVNRYNAGTKWSEADPHYGLGILALLQHVGAVKQ